MTATPERQRVVNWVEEALTQGARKEEACKIVGIHRLSVKV